MKHHYLIDFTKFTSHFVTVTLTLTAEYENPTFYLPSWIAGSYMIREFAKHISQVLYRVNDGDERRAAKLAKNRWQIIAKQGDELCIFYPVYCYDLSVRMAYVDSERIFANFSSLLLIKENTAKETTQSPNPCQIDLKIPKAFYDKNQGAVLACGLTHQELFDNGDTIYRFDALPNGEPLSAFEAMDFPFEIAIQDFFEFSTTCQNVSHPHRFFISGRYHYDKAQLKKDVQAICQAYADALGWMPFFDYTFMTYASKDDYGGLEHINSTALVIPRDTLPVNETDGKLSDNYLEYLGLCSHEYFHAWWVKSVRPDVMMTSQLDGEAYTPLLWVFEGFTSYIDDLMLYVSGRVNKTKYLELLSGQITRYLNNIGRSEQSVSESSFDAWIKLYRPDENSPNSTVSYYNKGAIVAWGLDLLLCRYGYRLFDVVRAFVDFAKDAKNARFGMSDDNLTAVMTRFLPADVWQHFYENYVNGVTPIPFDAWLDNYETTLEIAEKSEPFGIVYERSELGLTIKRLAPHSDAAKAGLSALDVIVAIDELKADTALLQSSYQASRQHKRPSTFYAFRRDMLLVFKVDASDTPITTAKAVLVGKGKWLD